MAMTRCTIVSSLSLFKRGIARDGGDQVRERIAPPATLLVAYADLWC